MSACIWCIHNFFYLDLSIQEEILLEHSFGFDLQEENDVQGFSDQQVTD
jgi:hypothetical protein